MYFYYPTVSKTLLYHSRNNATCMVPIRLLEHEGLVLRTNICCNELLFVLISVGLCMCLLGQL